MKLVGPRTDLCVNLARHLGCDFVEMDRRIFPDGEINPRILQAPTEVILVNTLSSSDFDPNKYLLEYVFSIKNLRERGTKRIVMIMPYLPYSRQDAVFREGESFTSKYILEIFRDLGIEDIFAVTYHLHRLRNLDLAQGITLHNVSGIDALKKYFKLDTAAEAPLFVAPDEEAEKWARRMAGPSGDVAVLTKKRDYETGEVKTSGNIPQGRNAIIVDDMISTGKTVLNAVEICRRAASKTVRVAVVHGIFSQVVAWDVDMTTTNTIDNPFSKVDVAPLIAERVWEQL